MIHVICTICIAPGRRDDFIAEFNGIVPQVLAEKGCLAYGPTVDVDTDIERQAVPADNEVVIIEKWETLDDLKAHLVAPHMNAYRERVKEMVENGHLRITKPA
ncbi:MAG: antibiotic biosynthesis monooxygenase [Planctomycetaceae bacterium]|nr:antibiotic biosynthesis monooxygenase [Planctomycetaceae bacterium]|tara:strand:- start:4282 stop:4590 length:309 start_codon:yes stop_codon:yes gene_type:complete